MRTSKANSRVMSTKSISRPNGAAVLRSIRQVGPAGLQSSSTEKSTESSWACFGAVSVVVTGVSTAVWCQFPIGVMVPQALSPSVAKSVLRIIRKHCSTFRQRCAQVLREGHASPARILQGSQMGGVRF